MISRVGDHSTPYPLIRAHANPFARIMEEFPNTRLVQAGISTATGNQREQVARFGVEMIEMRDLTQQRQLIFEGTCLSFSGSQLPPFTLKK